MDIFFFFCIINAMRLIGNLCCFISVNFEYQLVKSIHPKSFGVRPFLAFLGISKCFHQLWSGYSKYTPSIEPTKCDSRSENIESTSALALFTLLISFSCCFNIFKANTWIELLMVYLSTRHCFRRDKIPFQFAVVFGFFFSSSLKCVTMLCPIESLFYHWMLSVHLGRFHNLSNHEAFRTPAAQFRMICSSKR